MLDIYQIELVTFYKFSDILNIFKNYTNKFDSIINY